MTAIWAFIPGKPVPKGSARAFVRRGRAVVTHANKKTKPWQRRATEIIQDTHDGWVLAACEVECVFTFLRPPSHLDKRGEVRKGKPAQHTTKPDVDKLLRAALDSITDAGVWPDDSYCVSATGRKFYTSDPAAEGVTITIIERTGRK